jgi:hypothetical protein
VGRSGICGSTLGEVKSRTGRESPSGAAGLAGRRPAELSSTRSSKTPIFSTSPARMGELSTLSWLIWTPLVLPRS